MTSSRAREARAHSTWPKVHSTHQKRRFLLMSSNPTRRIQPAVLQADIESFAALQAITDYAPANAAYTVAAITAAKQNMETKQTAETQAAAALAAARDGGLRLGCLFGLHVLFR